MKPVRKQRTIQQSIFQASEKEILVQLFFEQVSYKAQFFAGLLKHEVTVTILQYLDKDVFDLNYTQILFSKSI